MAINVGSAVERGVRRVATPQGATLVAAFAVVAVGVALLWESVLGRFVAGDGFFAFVPPDIAAELRGAWANYEVLLEVGLPVEALLGVVLALWLVRIVLRVGAIRWFVGDADRPLAGELFTDRLGWTVLNLVAGTVLYGVAVLVGLVILVVPGVFLAVALFFFNYEVIVEGENAVDALSNSWSLTAGDRLKLFILGALFAGIGLAASTVGNPAVLPGRLTSVVLGAALSAAVGVVGIATAADAYTQLQADAVSVEEPIEDELAAS